MRNWYFSFFVIVGLIALLTACGGGESSSNNVEDASGKEKKAEEQVLRLASSSEIPTMDSGAAVDATSSNAMGAAFSGLMRLDEEENPVPDMAAEDPEISDDLKIWTFKIREDVEWSDGSPVTANDFEYAWKRAINPNKESSQYSFLFEAVGIKNANEILDSNSEIYGEIDELGVKAIDEKTLEVEFDYPQPFFKSILWFGPFLPLKEDFVENEGEEYAQEADKILYNGPYKMSEWNQGESWTWEKNEDYWDASSYHLEKVEFRVVKDLSTQVKLYEQGEIDQTDLKGEEMITKFQDNPEFEEGLEASTMSIRIGQRDSTLKNKKIRKALYNGINREGLTDILLNDGSVPAHYIVPKEFVEGPDGDDFRDKYPEINKVSMEEAIDLWKEGKKEENIDEITYTLYLSDKDEDDTIASYIQAELEDNFEGLSIEIVKQPWKAFLQSYLNEEYDLSYIGFSPDYNDPVTFLDIFTTGHQQNTMGIDLEEYNDIIADAKRMTDEPEKRWESLQEAEKLLLEESSDIPLFQKGHSWIQKPYVKDMRFPVYGVNMDWYKAYIVE